jgi:hypothetical protein
VSGLVAGVASLASRVERTTTGRSALLADVAKFATGVALHGLRLAVTGEVVGPAALVAGRSPAGLKSTASTEASTLEATSADRCASTSGTSGSRTLTIALSCISRSYTTIKSDWMWTYSQVAGLVAVVATVRPSTDQSERRAVGLNMA